MHHISFKRHIGVHPVPGDGVFLLIGGRTVALHGEMIQSLAPLLDGSHTRDEVVRRASGAFPADRVGRQLDRLAEAGFLVEGDPAEDPRAAGYWELAGGDADAAERRITRSAVKVTGVGGADTAPLTEALRAAGLRVTEHGADLEMAVTDHLLHPHLLTADEQARRSRRPWCVVKLTGGTAFLSPVLEPGRTACWHCAAFGLSGRHIEAAYVEGATGGGVVPAEVPVGDGLVTGVAARLAALRVARWMAGVGAADSDVLTFDTLTLRSEPHRLVRRPQCPACGDPDLLRERALRPVVLARPPGRGGSGDGRRVLSPEALLSRYGHLVSPVTGIVTELTPQVTGTDLVHVCTAVHNFTLRGPGARGRRGPLRGQSAGKGTSAVQARAGALGEAIERFSAVWQGDEQRVRAAYGDLAGEAVHPDALQLYSARQYANRAEWNARGVPFHRVPRPFDEKATHDWTAVWSLTGRRHVHVPTAALYYGHPHPSATAFVTADSNGAAAGGTLEEAVSQGLLELIERDSVALWWYNRLRRPAVTTDACARAPLGAWREAHAALGREAWVLDLTSDLGIPVAAAVSRRADSPREGILMGFGAGLDMGAAVSKAMNEADQLLPVVAGSESRDAPSTPQTELPLHWWRAATVENQPYLRPWPDRAGTPGPGRPGRDRGDPVSDADTLRQAVERGGMEVLVADLTRPDIGLPVVKVLVPGLRHFWPRYAPGRLYEVPVRLGWLAAPTAEEDLNPIPLFL
ncbi:TOMM precursor leader peptide-binding protein [Streptomyces sp. LP11]|uniref:TOMM leader peptide-binding protein n=1 Tax=Streptomyces pyxinicus TaxID=2970331 RepID=A0ABT2B6K6_9ACTN|nr:TOMM precursor leader peptide-binding protein [Streptomyces sp. LP11]MCS0604144.1 TOMM precursor leader peptide-binding protein [Streptomyces sp. LP11]